MKKIAFLPTLALVVGFLALPYAAQGQVTITDLGSMGPGDSYSETLDFATGGEIYVWLLTTTADCTIGSGNIGVFHSLDSVADTELAIYEYGGYTLVSGNDDGETGFWGDPAFSSLMYFGTPRVGNDDPYQGITQQGNDVPWPTDLPAGDYVVVMGTYNTTWDELDARDTGFAGDDVGSANFNVFFR